MTLIPLFVADRPVSLEILKGLEDHSGKFGILSHAFTTENFKIKFREFQLAKYKIGDSGIYQGKEISYSELFNEYVKMGVTHGIIKDYYRDPIKTLESAKQAMDFYNASELQKKFELIGVAQGNSVEEYLQSYEYQKNLGYKIIAVGGLLSKIEKHVRMVKVLKEEFMTNLLRTLRSKYPTDMIFPLGIFSRSRISLFKELNIWATDYKGWIFRYDKEQSHKLNDRFEQTRDYIATEIFPLVQKNRLLIMSCSESKNHISGPSLQVYNGKSYQMLRKYFKDYDGLDVRIISAKYGLISKDKRIDFYDEKLTTEKALGYRRRYSREIKVLLNSYDDVFVYGSTLYRTVLGKQKPKHSEGKIGEQLHQLKEWLYK
ncbi:MAG: DUF6884 domain-containing protein [Thermoplasmataceae archaeon]